MPVTSPEVLLISAVLRRKDHVVPAARGICADMFHGCRDEWTWIESYVALHSRTPSVGAFRGQFPELVLKKVDDVEYFCERVREENSRITLQRGLNEVIQKLRAGDVQGAIKQMSAASVQAEASFLGRNADSDIFSDFEDIEQEVLRRKRRAARTGFSGIPTGFPTLDELTGGLQPGWLVVVAARAGVGKTRSLVRMACAATFSGFTSQYDALEQTRAEIGMQVHSFASSEFGIETFQSIDLAKGTNFSPRRYRQFLEQSRDTVRGKMHVADNTRGGVTPSTMAAQVERNKADIFFLDYLTLVEGADDWGSIGNISTALKRLGTRYHIPVVTAAQINRKGADSKENDLSHIAYADRIGQDADLVIIVNKISSSVVSMRVIKNRHGRSGIMFYLSFDPNRGVMEEITYEEAMDLRDFDASSEDEEKERKFTPRRKGSFMEDADRMAQGRNPVSDRTLKRTYGSKTVKLKIRT
jgi:replicative DNA helicase